MRKFIIYCLVVVLLVGLVPVGANAEEPEVYEITIYPNRMQLFSLDSNNDLVLGDVKVSYDVDYENDSVDIYFEEPIFINDVISRGNTVHKSIKFNSENDERIVNKSLDTSGFSSDNVTEINLNYENVNDVDEIQILSSAGVDNWIGLIDDGVVEVVGDVLALEHVYDNNLNKNCVFNENTGKSIEFIFDSSYFIYSYAISFSGFSTGDTVTIIFYKLDGTHVSLDKDVGYINNKVNIVNIENVTKVEFISNKENLGIKEFELFGEERQIDIIPPSEVTYLNVNVDGNNVELSWINPTDEDFTGINIYRDDVLIEQNYIGEIYNDEILDPGEYTYKITTVDSSANESEGVSVSVKIEKLPEEVKNLNYIVDGNNIVLTWTNPESPDFEGVNIYRDEEYITTTTEESFSEDLLSGIYQYRITTIDSGKESPGITIDVSIQSTPTPVRNIKMLNKTSTGGLVTWDLNPTIENVEKYIVYVNGEKHGEIEAPPYPLEGLEEGKTYNIGVRAINSYGMSEPPATIIFTPTKLADIGNSIKVGIIDVFGYISMLFKNIWPLLALALAIIISPKIYNLIKTNVT